MMDNKTNIETYFNKMKEERDLNEEDMTKGEESHKDTPILQPFTSKEEKFQDEKHPSLV